MNINFNLIYGACYLPFQIPILASSMSNTLRSVISASGIDSNKCLMAKQVLPDLFNKVNQLRDDILIYLDPSMRYGASSGNHFGPQPCIIFNKEFAEELEQEDPDALHFAYQHEIGHIYFSHIFKTHALISLALSISSYVLSYFTFRLAVGFKQWPMHITVPISIVTSTSLLLAVRFITTPLIGYLFEKSADHFAIAYSTDQQLISGRRFFQVQNEALDELNHRLQALFPGKKIVLPYQKRWDFHPSNSKRIEAVEKEITKRGLNIKQIEQDLEHVNANRLVKNCYIRDAIRYVKAQLEEQKGDASPCDDLMNEFSNETCISEDHELEDTEIELE